MFRNRKQTSRTLPRKRKGPVSYTHLAVYKRQGLGVLPTLLEAAGLVEYGEVTRCSGLADSSERWMSVPVLFVIMLGGSFIKSIISASVAKETTEATRARGYSIFYLSLIHI